MEPSTFLPDMEETSNLLQTTSGLETDKQQFGSSIPIEYKDDDTRVQPAVKSNHSLDTSSVPDDVTEKFHWDASEANSVARLKHGEDASDEKRIRAFINLIKFHKQDKNPSGLISRKGQRKITLYKGMYREGIDFELAGCLGHGIIAGDVMTIKDKTTGELIAQKRVLISNFKPEEILASIALEKTLYPPEWYLFQLETNRIAMYMDIVRDAIRLDVIINDYMMKMDKRQRQAFSLFVFDGLLEAIEKMSDENWVHGDLHGGNVMIQNTLYSIRIRILDFGQAKKTRNIKQDIIQAVRHFSGLYIGDQFNDEHHLERTFADNEMKMAWTQTVE